MDSPYSTLQKERSENILNAFYSSSSYAKPEGVTPTDYSNGVLKKSLWDKTLGAVGKGVYMAEASKPTMLGSVARYAAGTLSTLTGKADEMQAVEDSLSEYASVRKMQLKDFDMDDELVEFAVKLDSFGRSMIEENQKYLAKHYEPSTSGIERFSEGIGQGFASMGEAIVIGRLTGGAGVMAYFGAAEAGDKYVELRNAGIDIDKAMVASSIDGVLSGGIEAMSTMMMINMASPNWFVRGLKSAPLEGLEEFLQEGVSAGTSVVMGVDPISGELGKKTDVKKVINSMLFSGAIGTIVGGATGIHLAKTQRDGLANLYEKSGLSKEESIKRANEGMKAVSDDALNDITKRLRQSLDEQTTILNKAYRMEELTADERAFLDNLYGKLFPEDSIADSEINTESDMMESGQAELDAAMKAEAIIGKRSEIDEGISGSKRRTNEELQQGALDEKAELIYTAREKQLDSEITTLEQEMSFLEKEISDKKADGRPTKALENKLVKLNSKWDSLNYQYADARDYTLKQLSNEYVKITPRTMAKIDKLTYKGLRKKIIDYARQRLDGQDFGKLAERMASAQTLEDVNAAIEKIDILADKFIKRKLTKDILKKFRRPQRNVAIEYQAKIEKIQNALGQTKKDQRKAVKDLSISELKTLAYGINEITNKGKIVLANREEQRKLAADIMEELVVRSVGDKARPLPGTNEFEKYQKSGGRIDYGAARPLRMIREIFGGKVGESIFYDSIDVADAEKMYNLIDRNSRMNKLFKKNKLNRFTLGKVINIGGREYTVNNLMRMAVASLDNDSYNAIKLSHELSDSQMDSFINHLKEKYPNYYNYAIETGKIVGERFNAIAESLAKIYNMPIKKVKNYFPIYREYMYNSGFEMSNLEGMMMDIALRNEGPRYDGIVKSFAIDRQISDNYSKHTVNLDFIGSASRAIEAQEHFLAYGALQKTFNKMKSSGRLEEAVRANKGAKAWITFENYLTRVINPGAGIKSKDFVSRYARRVRKALSESYIGLNMVTVLKQFPSIALALRYASLPQIVDSVVKVAASSKYREEVLARDPRLAERIINRDINELLRQRPDLIKNDIIRSLAIAKTAIGSIAFKGVSMMDSYVVMAVSDAAYNQSIKTKSEQEALNDAIKAVIETQPQGGMKDLPAMLATDNEVLRLMVMFTNQINQIYNMIAYDIGQDIKAGEKEKAMGNIAGILISSFLIYLASHGGAFPEDEEEQKMAIFEALFGSAATSLPIFGPMLMTMLRGYNPSLNPVDGVIKSLMSVPAKFKNEQYIEGVIDAAANASILAGVGFDGYSQMKRTLQGVRDLSEWNTDDWRRVIWSESSLYQK